MADTIEIGAARVRLDVDSQGYHTAIDRGINAARTFGTEAERGFDRATGGARRAAERLLDYVAGLGKADSAMQRYVSQASRAGVEESVIKAAVKRWYEYEQQINSAANAQREMNKVWDEAKAINAEFASQRTASTQDFFNTQLGVSTVDPAAQARRRADAEAALVPILQQQEREYTAIWDMAQKINEEFDRQRAMNAQRQFNQGFGVEAPQRSTEYLEEQQRVVRSLTMQFHELERAEAEAFAHDRNVDAYIQQLRNIGDTAGKTYYELLELKAAQLGVSQQAAPLIARIRSQNEAMGAGTISAKQYEWAMRGLPAQFTDIFTSLAAGQNPMMVLLQQGGQIKDMFGGIVPAARAMGTALWGMVNPVTVIGAVLATLAVAAYQSEQRLNELSEASIFSGGFAGTTSELKYLADTLAEIEGISFSNADAAVISLAKAGALSGEAFDMAAEATARWASVTGESADEVSSKFASIARDPLNALMKLNEAEHFLTEAQYERIKALVDEGDTQRAATEGVEIYTNTINNRTNEVLKNLGAMSSQWREIKGSISNAWEEVVKFTDFIAAANEQYRKAPWWQYSMPGIAAVRSLYTAGDIEQARIAAEAAKPLDAAAANSTALTREQQEALKALDKQLEDSGTKAERYQKALERLNNSLKNVSDEALRQRGIIREAGGSYSGEGYKTLLTSLQQKYKETKTKLPSGRDDTQAIKDQLAVELAALSTQTRQVEIQYQLRQISVEDYYARLKELAQQELDATTRANNAQISALAGKRDEERQVHTLRSANARAEEEFARRTLDLDAQQTQALRQRKFALDQYVYALQDSTQAMQRQMDARVLSVSIGGRELEQLNAQNRVYETQADLLRDLAREAERDPTIDVESRKAAIYRETGNQLDIIRDGYTRLATEEADWSNGAQRAWEDFKTQTVDVASTMYKIWTDAFNSIGQGLSDLVLEGKTNFDDMIKSMLSSLLKLATNQFFVNMLGGTTGFSSFFFADGGVPGGEGLSKYRNQLVSSPIVFPFAKGGVPNIGVAGEAGTEGIFPMLRDSKGRLGVSAVGANSAPPNVNINVYGAPSQPDVRTSQDSNGDLNIDVLFDSFDNRMAQGIATGTSMTGVAIKNMQRS